MQLHDLPDDVLLLILEVSLGCHPEATAALKANLPLLAVCRRWRELALAPVYSDLTICYGTEPSNTSGPGNGQANSADDEPDNAEITMSPDLVVAAGYVQMVRQVKIIVYHKNSPLPGLDAVVQLMHTAAEVWRGVRQLEISTFLADQALVHWVNVAAHRDRIDHISAALAATMPGVCRVHFDSRYASSVVAKLGGQLAVLYSDQLEDLTSRHPITIPQNHTFGQLESASIQYDSSISYQHPRVDPAKLVSLELTFWPVDHLWTPFSAGDDSEVIEFPNLKNLGVMYESTNVVDGAGARHRDGHSRTLHFPKLDRLTISCRSDACLLLDCAVLPQRMGEISIQGAAPVLVRVAEMRLPTTQRLRVSVSRYATINPTALAAANRILKSAQESAEKALCVKYGFVPVLPEYITCTSLTELEIQADTSADSMLGLIRMLPGLIKLSIWRLTLSNIKEDISVPGPDEACLVRPLGSKIEEITIDTYPDEPALEIFVLVAKYLLLRVPALARLCSTRLPRRPIAEFVNAYSKRYPHLAAIEYKLCNDD